MKCYLFLSNSGGHIFPGLALGKALVDKGYEVTYVASDRKVSQELLRYEDTIFLKSSKVRIESFKDVKRLNRMIEKGSLIIGFGGYVSLIGMLVAIIKGLHYYLFEANSTLGKANALGYLKARKVITFFPYKLRKCMNLGTPVTIGLKRSKVNVNMKKILLLGGSLGSETLLDIYQKLIETNPQYSFTLVLGKNGKFKGDYPNLKVLPFIERTKYIDYDLVIARAGGSTIAELSYMGIPHILVPSPYVSFNHQEKNATKAHELFNSIVIKEDEDSVINLTREIGRLSKYSTRKNQALKMSDMCPKFEIERFTREIERE